MIKTFGSAGFGPHLNGITALSLGKPAAAYPGRVATDADLMIAVDRQQTRLAASLDSSALSMTVENAAAIGAYNLLTIDNEIVKTTGAPAGNVVPISRGFDGTTPALHLSSAVVSGFIDSYHHNALVAEVEAIQQSLGANLANLPLPVGVYNSAAYNFTPQSPGVSLVPGANAFTLSPIPNGPAVGNSLWISGGTGTAEAVAITGWNPATGAIIVNCANAHTGAWTIGSASFGVQEAVVTAQAAGGGLVVIPAGNYVLRATIRITGPNITLQGAGVDGTAITRTGDFGDSIRAAGVMNIDISGFSLTHTINYAEGPPPTIINKPTSGAHVRIENCAYVRVHDTYLSNLPYGIVLDSTGWTRVYRNTLKSVWDAAFPAVQVGVAAICLTHSYAPGSHFGYPTYTWVERNIILGYASAPRTVIVNGISIPGKAELVGQKYGVLVESCEVAWITNNGLEVCNIAGIGIIAVPAHAPVTDAFLALDIGGNYIDYNRLYGIVFDMTANINEFALGTRVHDNLILGSGSSLNGIYFTGPAVSGQFVRTAAETVIADNTIRDTLGSAILMMSSGNTSITGNIMDGYNSANSYPTNSPADRVGNSGVYAGEAAAAFQITGNRIGGYYLGATYNGSSIWTRNGVALGTLTWTSGTAPAITTPNTDGGVQAPGLRSPAVAYDPAFFSPTITPSTNYIAAESGANNAIAGSLAGVELTPGLRVTIKLAHTLQAGANTFAYNGGAALAIKSSRNVANDIATAYAATGVISLMYDGTRWVDDSQ